MWSLKAVLFSGLLLLAFLSYFAYADHDKDDQKASLRVIRALKANHLFKRSLTTDPPPQSYYPHLPYEPKEDVYDDKKGKDRYRPNGYNRDDDDDSESGDDDKDDMFGSMTIWIRAADDWDNRKHSKKYPEKKYNKDKGYNDVKFPVRRYRDIDDFPRERYPRLLSIFPWLPIFYDKITYQTFIFSPTGGIYILPPLINFYGRRFAVAQLIKWGYASLVSSGAPPPPNVNVAPLVQPAPVGGAPVAGAPVAGGPVYDSKKEKFVGGVKVDYPNFKPRYSQTINEGGQGYGNERSAKSNAYGGGENYGGTGRQEVYARGGPQAGGGYN